MTTRFNTVDPRIDIQGALTVQNARNLPVDEAAFMGLSTSNGVGDAISAPAAGLQTITDAAGLFVAADVGRFITIAGSAGGLNDGTFLVTANPGPTQLTYLASPTGAAEPAYAGAWKVNEPYTLADDINFERTDRKNIKGTAQHYTAVPTYTRPDATGTPVPANLTNIAGKTTDAKPIVRDVLAHNTYLRPPVTGTGTGNLLIGDETFTTDNYEFTSGDLNSFITISGSTDADGTYRIKAVTDGKTLELDGLASLTAEGCNWALVAGVKGVLSARNWADATDTTGIPIADAGAYDNLHYDATYVEMIDPVSGHHPSTNAGLALWGRSFGDVKDPKKTVTNEGTRFFVQLMTGVNDGTATVAALQQLAGRSGNLATIAGGNKQIGGLTGMTSADVGRYISIWECGNDQAGIYEIASVDSATQVTVVRTANFVADGNTGAILWAISAEDSLWDFYYGDRWRLDQLDDTAFRTTMIGGITSDAALATAIHNLQIYTGENPGVQHPVLTNTGNWFIFSDLPNAATSNLTEIVQAINDQIGDRNYVGGGTAGLLDGETITASILKLESAVNAANTIRHIERLAAGIAKFAVHNMPAGVSYTVDGTNNGLHLWVFWRGLLRDPGTVANGDDYAETSGAGGPGGVGQIQPYHALNAQDHINYIIVG